MVVVKGPEDGVVEGPVVGGRVERLLGDISCVYSDVYRICIYVPPGYLVRRLVVPVLFVHC